MAVWNPRANDIFLKALEAESPEERHACLDVACGEEPLLRVQVEALLAASERAGSFLQSPIEGMRGVLHDPVRERPGTMIGPYKLMEQVGEGGMGLVFVAEQQQPVRRKVALKVIKPGMDTRQVVARFEAERQALALMDHPNIAKVFDGGESTSGRPYFVMELVKGVPITDYCDLHQVPIRQRLELFGSVCQAVQHAHQKGIIHRDIKPSNALVMSHDGTPVVKVIDFGVAKAIGQPLTDKTIYTQFSQMVGTPMYMSPEQAGGSSLEIDTRSDIYSLGVLLYELLTGTTPFAKERLEGVGYDELHRIIREEEPARPSTRISTLGQAATTVAAQRQSDPKRLGQLFRGELDWIVMKCLEKDRNRRYETANSLAKDVERYLHDEPVQAWPPSFTSRLRKFARRNRTAVTAAALAVGLVPLPAVWPSRSPPPRRAASLRGRRWEAAAAVILFLVVGLSLTEATGVTHLVPTVIRIFTPDGTLVVEVDDPGVKVTIEGDGGILITGAGPQEVRLRPGNYKVRATREGKPVRPEELITITHGAKRVVKVSLEATAATAKERQPAGAQAPVPQQPPLAAGEVRRFVGHTAGINGLAISRDGRHILTGARDRTLRLWDIETGREIRRFEGHTGTVCGVALSPDGRRALSSSGFPLGDKTLRYWDVDTGKELPFWRLRGVWGVAFSPDGLRVLTSDRDYRLRLRELASGKEVQRFVGHTEFAQSVDFSPNGRFVLSGSADKTMRLWDAETGREMRRFDGHTSRVWCVTFSPDGRRALSCGDDTTLRLWDIETGEEIRRFEHRPWDRFNSAAFSPDGRYALSGGDEGVRLWEVETGNLLHEFKGHTAYIEPVAFTPDGRYALSAGADGDNTIRLWKLPQEVRPRRSPKDAGRHKK
jgi:WD40 repeat protein/serine/threonine protein kinase